jgi:site-specific recombinase XerD
MAYCCGPLARHTAQFSKLLVDQGYTPHTVKKKRTFAAKFGAWMGHQGLTLAKLNDAHLTQFQADQQRVPRGDNFTGAQLLKFLRHIGVTPCSHSKIDRSPLSVLTRDYENFLSSERGLARATVAGYLPTVKAFLKWQFNDRSMRLQNITTQGIHRFIISAARRVSRTRAKQIVAALRSFLRFLHARGMINIDLAGSVSGVADWRLTHIPKSLDPETIERVLQSCDRRTPIGQRDYAMLLLLARLGLRSGEVLSLTLDDLDWEQGEILVRGKCQRIERMPLPREVGSALVSYLRNVRPRSLATRRVFIRQHAPWEALRATAICGIVRRALARAGVDADFKGAHLFRHSVATNMLSRGASLGEIGQLLRHLNPRTTQIYAKVDIEGLRDVAHPWMGGTS